MGVLRRRKAVHPKDAIDVAVACAALSRSWRGTSVTVSDEVRLLAARHPLLDPARAVPIDLDLGGLRALVITGPDGVIRWSFQADSPGDLPGIELLREGLAGALR